MGALDARPPPPLSMDSMDELRAYLWKVHQATVDPADPILMLHTIHRVALDEFSRLLDQHNRALSDQVRGIAANVAAEIRAVVDEFKSDASAAAVKARVEAIQEATRLADTAQAGFRRNLRLLLGITALNIVAVVFVLGALTILVR